MHKRAILGAAFAVLAFPSLIPSCASSSGATFSSAASSESAAARARKPAKPSEAEAPGSPAPGSKVPPRKAPIAGGAYYPAVKEPEQPRGWLVLEGLEAGSAVSIDGRAALGASFILPSGRHELRVRRFGYADYEASAAVARNETTRMRVVYEDAPFEIRGLDASPHSFDPADPGYLGSCWARVLVSAKGAGSAYVVDGSGRIVRSLGRLGFEGPSLGVRWDGRDDAGEALPAGGYLIRVEGSGPSGESSSAETSVSIVSGLFARSTTLYSGVSGTLFAPDARSLPSGRFEASSGAALHLSPGGQAMSGLLTAQAGLRFGLPSSSGDSEMDFSYMLVAWQDDPSANSFSLTAAWKRSLGGLGPGSAGAAAVYVKGTIARFFGEGLDDPTSPSWDGTTRYAGLSIGLPLEYALGRARAFAAPELEMSGYYPNWAVAGAPWAPPGFFAWGYLRLGLEASIDRFTASLSGALRTRPFGSPLALSPPFPLGLELRWHAPSSPIALSFMATGEIEDLGNYYLGAGIGLVFEY